MINRAAFLDKPLADMFHEEVNRGRRDEHAARAGKERELAKIVRKLDGLIDAIAEGYRTSGLQQRLDDLEARKAALEQELSADPPPPVRLHPNLARIYRSKVERLHEALADPALRDEALAILRGLIDQIKIEFHGARISSDGVCSPTGSSTTPSAYRHRSLEALRRPP